MRHGKKLGGEGEAAARVMLGGLGYGFSWDENGMEWDTRVRCGGRVLIWSREDTEMDGKASKRKQVT